MIIHDTTATRMEMMNAIINPNLLVSIPFFTFIPNKDATSVVDIIRIDTDVRVRMTVFILLLIMLEYVSIVDSKMSE